MPVVGIPTFRLVTPKSLVVRASAPDQRAPAAPPAVTRPTVDQPQDTQNTRQDTDEPMTETSCRLSGLQESQPETKKRKIEIY